MSDWHEELSKVLEGYAGRISEVLDRAAEKAAKNTVKRLKALSPRRTGKYASSWGQKAEGKDSRIIYNRERYQLTHLLEYGHAKVNGDRVAPRPHIAEAERAAVSEFVDLVKKGVGNG